MSTSEQKLNPEEFILRAISVVSREKGKTAVHVVYDGLNEALREYFGSEIDVRNIYEQMQAKGLIEMAPRRGGPIVFLPGFKPKSKKILDLVNRIIDFERR